MNDAPTDPSRDRSGSQAGFRVGFVPGVMPDKWFARWRERFPTDRLDACPRPEDDQEESLRERRVDICFVRLPVDREGLHVIPLYVEEPVAVLSVEHELTLLDELGLDTLAGEQLVLPPETYPGWAEAATVTRLDFPAMSVKDAVEVVASGTGFVVVPRSLARLHHRKDVTSRPVPDGPEYPVGLAWLKDNDDERVERFVGIVRGRTARTSRTPDASRETAKTQPKGKSKHQPTSKRSGTSSARSPKAKPRPRPRRRGR